MYNSYRKMEVLVDMLIKAKAEREGKDEPVAEDEVVCVGKSSMMSGMDCTGLDCNECPLNVQFIEKFEGIRDRMKVHSKLIGDWED